MMRRVEPEWLDHLEAGDPRALGSRRDLRRINAIMASARIVARELHARLASRVARVAEIGAGDGMFALEVAARLSRHGHAGHFTLVDRAPCAPSGLEQRFRALGWTVEVVNDDAFAWLRSQGAGAHDAVATNLFLHHFEGEALRSMLRDISRATAVFVALEPRRSHLALLASRLLGAIGCNDVTRHDAPVSVVAGFSDTELSALWPSEPAWKLREEPRGLFGHCLGAALEAR